MINGDEVIYSINIEDIQSVAIAELERELTSNEIEQVKDMIGKKISWYDAIADSISELLEDTQT